MEKSNTGAWLVIIESSVSQTANGKYKTKALVRAGEEVWKPKSPTKTAKFRPLRMFEHQANKPPKFRISTFSDAGSCDSQPPSSSSAEDDQKNNYDETRLKREDIKGEKM